MSSQDITLIVKTYERPWAMSRLLHSLKVFGWTGPIHIFDDSLAPVNWDHRFADLQIDCILSDSIVGVSVGRNRLLERVRTKYFFCFDDDFLVSQKTFFPELLKKRLEDHNLDLLAFDVIDHIGNVGLFLKSYGRKKLLKMGLKGQLFRLLNVLVRRNMPRDYIGFFKIEDNVVETKFIKNDQQFVECDIVLNCFIAKTHVIKAMGGWDKNLKTLEHLDFFLQAKKSKLRVGHSKESSILHIRYPSIIERIVYSKAFNRYKKNRYGDEFDFKAYHLRKYSLKDWLDFPLLLPPTVSRKK